MIRDRGVSVTLSYVIMLAIATAMLVTMLTVVGGLVDSQMNHAVRDELSITGESLATEMEQADRLYSATAGNATTLEMHKQLPGQVSGHSYSIVVNGTAGRLTLSTTRPDVSVTIPVNATTVPDGEQTVRGGPVTIRFGDDTMEVEAR